MVARAYHDSSFVSCIAPAAMLFIPCRGGVSHRPDEYASPEWIGGGVHVLARTLGRACGIAPAALISLAAPLYAIPQPARQLRLPQP